MSVRVERRDWVLTVIRSRPEARKAVDPEHAEVLYQAFVAFDCRRNGGCGGLLGRRRGFLRRRRSEEIGDPRSFSAIGPRISQGRRSPATRTHGPVAQRLVGAGLKSDRGRRRLRAAPRAADRARCVVADICHQLLGQDVGLGRFVAAPRCNDRRV
jgi:hypothetical protein